MVDIKLLERRGISAKNWRKLFEGKEYSNPVVDSRQIQPKKGKKPKLKEGENKDEQLSSLLNHIRSRVQAGIDYNLANYRLHHAVDLLWDAPSRQLSPSLIPTLIGQCNSTEDAERVLKSYGFDLEQIFTDTKKKDPKTGRPIKRVNFMPFVTLMVPLIRAYVEIRRAKLLNDRNVHPLIKYEPAFSSLDNVARCEVLNSRVQVMADQYGHLNALSQSIFQMLHYGICTEFTRETWHTESQLRAKTGQQQTPVNEPDLEIKSTEESYVTKEGLRYHHPHPTRVYWDQSYPVTTLNTDTGCAWIGNWHVTRYGELKAMEGYYNLDKVTIGDASWWTNATGFLNAIYGTCIIKPPAVVVPEHVQDREAYLTEHSYYNSEMFDQAVVLVEHREKIVPSRWGLGNYDYPIWTRWVLAGDETVLYAEPLGYSPVNVCKANGDDKRLNECSLSLQLGPYQDMLGNLLSQYIYTAKQNLANVTFYNKQIITEATAEWLKNLGANLYTGINLAPYDPKQLLAMKEKIGEALYSHSFPKLDTNGLIVAMRTVIDIAERVLQFSSQEVAQAASHEQSATEQRIIAASTTNILSYTGIPVDDFMFARSRQIYEALMNYGEDDFFAEVPVHIRMNNQRLEKLGFTVSDEPYGSVDRLKVKVNKSALALLTFAKVPSTVNRLSNVQAATGMATMLRDLLSNPVTQMAIGPDQAIDWTNQIVELFGLPLKRPLRNTGQTQEQARAEVLEIMNTVLTQVKQGMQPIIEQAKIQEVKVDTLYRLLGLPDPTGENANAPSNGSAGNGVPQANRLVGPTGMPITSNLVA